MLSSQALPGPCHHHHAPLTLSAALTLTGERKMSEHTLLVFALFFSNAYTAWSLSQALLPLAKRKSRLTLLKLDFFLNFQVSSSYSLLVRIDTAKISPKPFPASPGLESEDWLRPGGASRTPNERRLILKPLWAVPLKVEDVRLPKGLLLLLCLSPVQLFVTPWTAARWASLPFTVSQSLLRLMSTDWRCHPTISSTVTPSPPILNLSQHQGLFPMSQPFASGGQSIGASALSSVLPVNIQGWFPLGLECYKRHSSAVLSWPSI